MNKVYYSGTVRKFWKCHPTRVGFDKILIRARNPLPYDVSGARFLTFVLLKLFIIINGAASERVREHCSRAINPRRSPRSVAGWNGVNVVKSRRTTRVTRIWAYLTRNPSAGLSTGEGGENAPGEKNRACIYADEGRREGLRLIRCGGARARPGGTTVVGRRRQQTSAGGWKRVREHAVLHYVFGILPY